MRSTSRFISSVLALTLLASASSPAVSQDAKGKGLPATTVTSATDGIFAAFQHHPLVGLADSHGLAQEEDFFSALVRDKRFARDVGNVVVEFGDAAQQNTIDRYVSGDDVPYTQLRKVWEDNVGWIPTVIALGYIKFYAQVRAVNLGLPPNQRIHVWLGDPPIDWSKINTSKEFFALLNQRDTYPSELINTQILDMNKKALVIYGSGHFYGDKSLGALVEEHKHGAFFMVTPYIGFDEKICSDAFEQTTRTWPRPALATPVQGTQLEAQLNVSGCHFLPASDLGPNPTEADKQNVVKREKLFSGLSGHALLYLGPAVSLTRSARSPDGYMDLDFVKELDRRNKIRFGDSPESFIGWEAPDDSPFYFHPYGETKQPSEK